MRNGFESSQAAIVYFLELLSQRGIRIIETKNIRVSAGRGRFVYQQQIWTETGEIFHVKYWNKRWTPKPSEKVSDFAKPLDERIKYAIKTFGEQDDSASGLNESTLLELLDLSEKGHKTFLITIYRTGEILWCRVDELYYFATQHGLIPQFSQTYGEPFCWVPTGWLKEFENVIRNYPELSS